MLPVVFEAIEVLVSLSADFASIRLFLLHPDCTRVRNAGDWIDDRECAVFVFLELLVLVAMLQIRQIGNYFCALLDPAYLFVILETILVLIRFLASNNWTAEWLVLFWKGYACSSSQNGLFP